MEKCNKTTFGKNLKNNHRPTICITEQHFRGGSRTAATSKMERFVIIVSGWKPLTIITKHFILDVVAVLDPSLHLQNYDPHQKILMQRM